MEIFKKFLSTMTLIVVLVFVLANIELYINKKSCILSIDLSKRYNIILPEYTGFSDPIYIYNTKNVKRNEIMYRPGYNEKNYVKKKLSEHVASKISRPFRDIVKTVLLLPKSKTPINDLYEAVSRSSDMKNIIHPLCSSFGDYRMITSKRDDADGFVSDKKIYIIKGNFRDN